MKTFNLGIYDIVVNVYEIGGGSISSSLNDGERDGENYLEYEAAVNTIESMILAHACAGIPIDSPAYIEGIETAINTITNEYL